MAERLEYRIKINPGFLDKCFSLLSKELPGRGYLGNFELDGCILIFRTNKRLDDNTLNWLKERDEILGVNLVEPSKERVCSVCS